MAISFQHLQTTMESKRPFIYPLAQTGALAKQLKVGDSFDGKDQCKAVVGALAIANNTPFGGFRPNTATSLAAKCVCDGCLWGFKFSAKFGDNGRRWEVVALPSSHTSIDCQFANFSTHKANPPYSHGLLAHVLLKHSGQGKEIGLDIVKNEVSNYLPYAISTSVASKLKIAAQKLVHRNQRAGVRKQKGWVPKLARRLGKRGWAVWHAYPRCRTFHMHECSANLPQANVASY